MNGFRNVSLFFVFTFLLGACAQKDYDLKKLPAEKSPDRIGRQLVEKYLNTPHPKYGQGPKERKSQISYPDVCVWLGGLWFAKETKDEVLLKKLKKRFDPLFAEESHLQPKPNHVDNSVFGALPLELYLQTNENKYLELGLHYADSQWELPENAGPIEQEYYKNGYSWQTRFWIDDMFMITILQAQAYKAKGDEKYINRAAREMVSYLDSIQLDNGLFYHSPETPYSWGRGNGWMAVGMAELLRVLPENNVDRPRIMEGYHTMMKSLLTYQDTRGMWRQIIDDRESWEETSGTAMFTYAMITGVQNGWLNKKIYGVAAKKGWLALVGYLNDDYELTEVCKGTNIKNSREYYMNRPRVVGDLHGQAPLIWCAVALMQIK